MEESTVAKIKYAKVAAVQGRFFIRFTKRSNGVIEKESRMSHDLEPCRICGHNDQLMVYYEEEFWIIECLPCNNVVAGTNLLDTMLRWDYEQTKEVQNID